MKPPLEIKTGRLDVTFTGRTTGRWFLSRRQIWRVLNPCPVQIGALATVIPAGFEFDFASCPRLLQFFLPDTAIFGRAAATHDWLYSLGQPKGTADGALLDLLRDDRQPLYVRLAMTASVALFGWPAYNAHRQAKKTLPSDSP